MAIHPILRSQQSPDSVQARSIAAGCWTLPRGRAITLHPRRDGGFLEIAQGGAWITVTGGSRPAHDLVLGAGERCAIAAGQSAVLEAWMPSSDCGVAFRWDAAVSFERADAAEPVPRRALRAEWQQWVVQPWLDLTQALGAMGGAAAAGGRLVAGVARCAALGLGMPVRRSAVECSVAKALY